MADTEGFWANHGPLGLQNYRRQLGRSDELGDAVPAGQGEGSGKLRAILVETGATQKGDARAKGDAASSTITITTTYEGLNDANRERPLQVRGLVEWGCDGHQAQARFDWLQGTTVRVSGSFVRVIAEVADNIAAGELEPSHNTEAIVRVGAFVGYWGGSRPAQFTAQVLLASNVPAIVAIPTFAESLRIYGGGLSSAEWLLGPAAALQFSSIAPAPAPESVYPRPGPATHVLLSSAAAGLRTLVWGLSL